MIIKSFGAYFPLLILAASTYYGASAFATFLVKATNKNVKGWSFLTKIPPGISRKNPLDGGNALGASPSALSGLITRLISDCIESKRPKKGEAEETLPWERDLEIRLKELEHYIANNATFKTDLLYSIQSAQSTGHQNLEPKLYDAFLIGVNGWPSSIDEYFRFLTWFSSYVPQQSNYEGWLNGTTQDYNSTHQEVYDRLCHFYFLIYQTLPGGDTVQDNSWFAEWLVHYAQVWGKFCNTPDSISPQTIQSFVNNSKSFNVTDSMIPINEEDIPGDVDQYTIRNEKGQPLRPNSPSGWKSWNQMFARELNPGLRPIDMPTDNRVVCAPADCTFKETYNISIDSEIQNHIYKRTHNIGNVKDLLKGSKYEEAFAEGTYVHYFLGPYSYHRFHTPVAGVVQESFQVPGLTFLAVNITDKQFDAPDDSENGYEFRQDRGVITIDTTDSPYGDVGIVAIAPIGMSQVSSVSMIATAGANLAKGDEFGYFQFGGSDIIMLFQKGVVPPENLLQDGKAYNHYGMQVATAICLNN